MDPARRYCCIIYGQQSAEEALVGMARFGQGAVDKMQVQLDVAGAPTVPLRTEYADTEQGAIDAAWVEAEKSRYVAWAVNDYGDGGGGGRQVRSGEFGSGAVAKPLINSQQLP